MTAQAKRDIRRKLKILEHAEKIGNVRKTCRYYGISRQSFYNWKKRYVEKGDEGLINSKTGQSSGSSTRPSMMRLVFV